MMTAAVAASAQVNAVSPLSRYGMGETGYGVTPSFAAMSNTGIAYSDRFSINNLNPAGAAHLEYSTLEMSGISRSFLQQIPDEGLSQTNYNTYFEYFGFGLKLEDWWGASIALSPYSAKGYSVSVIDSSADFGRYEYRSVGTGGLEQLVIANGFQPVEWLSVGVNTRYIYGQWSEDNKTVMENINMLSVNKSLKTRVNDFSFDFGAQANIPLMGHKLTLGAVYGMGGALGAQQIGTQYTFINSGIVETPVDTLYYNKLSEGNIGLPSFYGVGVSFSKKGEQTPVNAYEFLADYKVRSWSEYSGFDGTNDGLVDATTLSVGGTVVPMLAFSSLSRSNSILAISRYRFGASYEVGQFVWNTNPYVRQELALGVSMPIIYRNLAPGEQKASFLNLGLAVGRRSDGTTASYTEDYLNFTIGMTLNDRWFQKFKYR